MIEISVLTNYDVNNRITWNWSTIDFASFCQLLKSGF